MSGFENFKNEYKHALFSDFENFFKNAYKHALFSDFEQFFKALQPSTPKTGPNDFHYCGSCPLPARTGIETGIADQIWFFGFTNNSTPLNFIGPTYPHLVDL